MIICIITAAALILGAVMTVNKTGEKENICDYNGGIEK